MSPADVNSKLESTISSYYYRLCQLACIVVVAALLILVMPPAPGAAQPSASFSWSISGLRLSVRASASGEGFNYIWIFGDGSQGSGRTTSHTYAEAGDYIVILIVIDNENNQSSSNQTIPTSAFNRRSSSKGAGKRSGGESQEPEKERSVVHMTCQTLPTDKVRVIPNSSEIQCQIIDSDAGISSPEIIEAGWIAAVDIWSVVGPGTEVCFRQSGNMVLLDTATSPRIVVSLEVYASDPWSCALIDRAGTVILRPTEPEAEATPTPVRLRFPEPEGIWDDNSPIVELEGCRVRTRVYVNFRFSPGGEQIEKTVIRYATTLDAIARTKHWFYVEYEETPGWISAHLVRAAGDCDLPEAENENP